MRSQIAYGAAWMLSMRLADRALGLVSTVVLARLLVPADFGLIAMAMSFIVLVELAGAFSFEVVLIQHPQPTRVHYDTAWTLTVCFALCCGLLMAFIAPVAAEFYSEPRLIPVMLAIAVSWAIRGCENIGMVNFRRKMEFSREFAYMAGTRVAGFIVTLVLAYLLRSYWALVVGTLVTRCAGVVLSYALEPYRPRLSLSAWRDLFSFSGWLLMINATGFGLARLSHFIIGRVFGTSQLGLYAVAWEIAKLPSTEVSAPINRALFPGLARLAGDLSALRPVFLDAVGVTIAITLPASVGLALVAEPLVDVMLGAKWQEAAPILAVLALAGAVEMVAANNSIVYLALGHPRTLAFLNAFKLSLLIGFAFLLVTRFGLLGMAIAELLASAVAVLVSTAAALRAIKLGLRKLIGVVWRPAFAAVIMSLAVDGILTMTSDQPFASSLVSLAAAVTVGVVTYLVALAILWIAAGRPMGAEQLVTRRARAVIAQFATKFARGS